MDRAALTALVALTIACSSKPAELPPLGEALIVVDTDLPLSVAQRLRVDVYENGAWLESRDVVLPSAASFPASFSVYSPDPASGRTALVRLRLHPEGRTRDYLGERYSARGAPDASGDGTPRLIKDGVDVTPREEPTPLTTVDRLLLVHVTPGHRGSVRVRLQGECLGTMADVAGAQTCIDGALGPVVEATLDPDMTLPTETAVGTYPPKSTCTVAPRPKGQNFEGEVCVDGALTFVGVPWNRGLIDDRGVEIPAVLSPFLIDVHEVTVGRFRAAVAAGLKVTSDDPVRNDAALELDPSDAESTALCTYSTTAMGRENYPLDCISREAARAFCQFAGGDLPTEAQWTYAAVIADRPDRTAYPWGNDLPDCDRAIFGRTSDGECVKRRHGPEPVDAAPGDASIGLGVIGMHGSVQEWMRDAFHRLYEPCWTGATLHDPVCDDAAAKAFSVGGVSFRQPTLTHDQRPSAARVAQPNNVGFRCVRAGT